MNAIDHKTKYILSHLFVKKRTIRACTEFLREIKTTCYEQILQRCNQEKHKTKKKRSPVIFVSDGFENYRNAFNKLFYRTAKLVFGIPIKAKKAGLKYNNNPIERYNGNIKDRIKVMRHFGSFDRAKYFLDLRRIIHNFINPHMGLKGRTPAEAAGIFFPLKRNKLLNLIKLMAKKRHHSLR